MFDIGSFASHINGISRRESTNMLQYFHDLITYGHDLQVRLKWHQPNDIGVFMLLKLHTMRLLIRVFSHLG
jgi:hypothetical protein